MLEKTSRNPVQAKPVEVFPEIITTVNIIRKPVFSRSFQLKPLGKARLSEATVRKYSWA
jgi:hypothetical protein